MYNYRLRNQRLVWGVLLCVGAFLPTITGCGLLEWANNGLRVGPNYTEPGAPIAQEYADVQKYSDADGPRIDGSSVVDTRWWRVFNDPDLEFLIDQLLQENLTLKAAVWRIAEARSIRNIAAANQFPQSQAATGQYLKNQFSPNADGFFPFAPITTRDWTLGFDASWELDLWGKIRRNVDAAEAQLEATVKDYDFAVVTLIGEVASLYITIVSIDERLALARENVKLLKGSLEVAQKRFDEGRTSKLDVVQAESNLAITSATIPDLELTQRQALNALAVLLAIPPSEISSMFTGGKKLPDIPTTAIVGIPAELLMRRPDIRSAERQLASQFEQIGIAKSEFYPTFSVSGNLGYQAAELSDLLQTSSYTGFIAPGFNWKILNYGRLLEGVNVEEARVNQLCLDFKNQVLIAQQEVEDGIVSFIKSSERLVFDRANLKANKESLDLSMLEYTEGKTNFGRVYVVQSIYVQSNDQVVATKANIALGLIETYKALGGGWEIRCGETVSTSDVVAPLQEATESAPAETPPTDTAPAEMTPGESAPTESRPADMAELRKRVYSGQLRSTDRPVSRQALLGQPVRYDGATRK